MIVVGIDNTGLATISIGVGGDSSTFLPFRDGWTGWGGFNINSTIPTVASLLHPSEWNIGINPYIGGGVSVGKGWTFGPTLGYSPDNNIPGYTRSTSYVMGMYCDEGSLQLNEYNQGSSYSGMIRYGEGEDWGVYSGNEIDWVWTWNMGRSWR